MHAKHKDGTYSKLVERPDGKFNRYERHLTIENAMNEPCVDWRSLTKQEMEDSGWTFLPDTLETLSVGQMIENPHMDSKLMVRADLGGFGELRCYLLSSVKDNYAAGSCVTAKQLKEMNYTVIQPEPTAKREVEAAKKLLEAEGWKVSK